MAQYSVDESVSGGLVQWSHSGFSEADSREKQVNPKNPMNIEPVAHEPWVKLANGESLLQWGREDEIKTNQQFRHVEKYKFYVHTFDFLKDNAIYGDYLEFGCHRVRTFRMALTEARKHDFSEMRFYAFDSFEGLPDVTTHPSTPMWQKGALCTSESDFLRIVREHGIYLDRIQAIKGFYGKSLTEGLKVAIKKCGAAAFICVDCDLYESAVPVFSFCEDLLQEGTVIYIDDYFAGYRGNPERGVAKAFAEFCARTAWKFQPHLSVGWWGRSFIAYR